MRCHAPVQAKADTNRLVPPIRRFDAEERAGWGRQAALPGGPGAGFSYADVPVHAPAARTAGHTGLPEPLKAGVERLSGLAMDDVRVHRDSPAPARLGALAFAQGRDIHLGPGQGRHLPHEAWHVVQQKQGRVPATTRMKGVGVNDDALLEAEADRMGSAARSCSTSGRTASDVGPDSTAGDGRPPAWPARTVQLRRVPAAKDLEEALPPGDSSPAMVGMARVLSRAWADLVHFANKDGQIMKPDSIGLIKTPYGVGLRDAVMKAMQPLTWTDEQDLFNKLTTRDLVVSLADAIRTVSPVSEMGQPSDFGKRVGGEANKERLGKLLNKANEIFDLMIGASKDLDLAQVFGAENLGCVKEKYANAKRRLGELIEANEIYSDESGYSEEVSIGGSATGARINLLRSTITNPESVDSVIKVLHESLHAGNLWAEDDPDNVIDRGYIESSGFDKLSATAKLTNAAHFEVVPRRHLGLEPSFAGKIFTPANEGPATTPQTPQDIAMREVAETFRTAWQASLWLHEHYLLIFKSPAQWKAARSAGGSFAGALPYWSNVEMLTIHKRAATIDSTTPGASPANRPVTVVDLALSEGLSRKLMLGLGKAPTKLSDARSLELNISLEGFTAAETDWKKGHDLLMESLIKSYCGIITGPPARDFCVVNELARAGKDPKELLRERDPSTFKC